MQSIVGRNKFIGIKIYITFVSKVSDVIIIYNGKSVVWKKKEEKNNKRLFIVFCNLSTEGSESTMNETEDRMGNKNWRTSSAKAFDVKPEKLRRNVVYICNTGFVVSRMENIFG